MVMGQLTTKADVAVIGGGPGGYTAAIRAAQLGLEVVLIEKDRLGGTCTNVGCIPSKALIHGADIFYASKSQHAKELGIVSAPSLDFKGMQAWKEGVVASLRDGIEKLCRSNGIEIIDGRAFFNSSTSLTVETESGLRTVEFGKAIIAVGTKIRAPPGITIDHKTIIDSDDVFSLGEVPGSLVILGGGYIAAEMAFLFAKLGSSVTIVYRGDRILKGMDPELTAPLMKRMQVLGIRTVLEGSIVSAAANQAIVRTPKGDTSVGFDRLLVCIGRTAHLDGLGLEKTAVKVSQGGKIMTDQTCKSDDDSIFAVGDVTEGPELAHKAFRQGKVAAECIAGKKSAFDNRAIPMVVFTDPEIAAVGLSEDDAKKAGIETRTGRISFASQGAAKASGEGDGFAKIVADSHGSVIGASAVGYGARYIIQEAALAIETAMTLEDIASTIHAHPTISEAFSESAEDALGIAIHRYRQRSH